MLRLDPARPPAWRDESTLQFGADGTLLLPHPEPWQEILLHALRGGLSRADAVSVAGGYGVDAARTRAFLQRLRPVLLEQRPARRIHLDVADAFTHPVGADAAQVLADDFRLVHVPRAGDTVVLLAAYLVHPARVAAMARDDLPHLPIVVSGDEATVGPLLVPGAGACLGCAAEHRRSADPAWPGIAAQLLGRPAPPVSTGFLAEALGLAARFLSGRAGARAHSHAVTISSRTLRRRWAELRVHPECGCRSPEENAIADARLVRSSPPRTATAYARPA